MFRHRHPIENIFIQLFRFTDLPPNSSASAYITVICNFLFLRSVVTSEIEMLLLLIFLFVCVSTASSFRITHNNLIRRNSRSLRARVGGESWQSLQDISSSNSNELEPILSFPHLGDFNELRDIDEFNSKKNADFNLNVGKAMEALRRELPMIFYTNNLDFSVFANHITVADSNQNKLVMQRNLYIAAVRSLKMASSFSSIHPSMNVMKIEYVEDCRVIQCLVDVVLPDTVRVDGQVMGDYLLSPPFTNLNIFIIIFIIFLIRTL